MTVDLLLYSGNDPFMHPTAYLLIAGLYVYGWLGAKAVETAVVRVRGVLSGPEPSAIEQLQEEYERGDLALQEFEQRVELALDDRVAVVVDHLEAVDGVGPDRAAAVADQFGNIEAIRRAEVDDLTDVHGVGPSTAAKILNEI